MSDKIDQIISENNTVARALFTKPVVVELPFSGEVLRDIPYGGNGRRADIYYPDKLRDPVPAVIVVTGYPDPGFEKNDGSEIERHRAESILGQAAGCVRNRCNTLYNG